MDFLGIGAPEIILVLLLAFVIFGPKRIMGISQEAGKALRNLSRDATSIKSQLENELSRDETGKPRGTDKSSPADRTAIP